MPRLFTALEVPAEIGTQLAFLRGGLPGARWIDVENYHVTLRFLGDVDDRTANEAALLLDGIAREPIQISIGELDAFGGDRPRSIIARVKPSQELLDLQAEHERNLRRAGLPPESRKYTPHVTLARLRDVKPREVADWLATRGGAPRLDFEAKRFVLYSSRASTGGGPYVLEESFPLGIGEEDEDLHDEAHW
jgi:RNA 2',3'-cyclic 3'-phosphodiesterase